MYRIMGKIIKIIKKLFSFSVGKVRSVYAKKRYEIKPGYIHGTRYNYFDDTQKKDEFQKEVYEMAKLYMDNNKYERIIDIGCGSGYKLITYFYNYKTIGVEVSPTYEFLVKKYPDRQWINAKDLDTQFLETDMIVCADVIEHVLYPNQLLHSIQKIKFKMLFLSTPERNISRGYFDYGPPLNRFHVREWTGLEFRKYISQYFDVISHQITNFEQSTQLLICKKYDPSQTKKAQC